MSDANRDGAAVRFPPPAVYVLALAAGALLQRVLPLPIPLPIPLRVAGAIALLGAGLALMAGAIGLFRKSGQNPAPWTSTPELIGSGPYRFTRNPMYVSMALLQAGLGVAAANGWIVLLVAPVVAIIQSIAIRHEEAYLERKFGAPYVAYKQRVRRWL